MAKSTGIVLGAAGISFANEWLQTGDVNFRIPVAGLGAALLTGGVERLNQSAGVGLATIAFVTVLLTPFNGLSPFDTLANLANGDPLRQQPTKTGGIPRGRPAQGTPSTRGTATPRTSATTSGGPDRVD